jgi:26S proteasome regulatory subunit N2
LISELIAYIQVVQHGASLGLGLAGLGTADEGIFEDIKNVLYTDCAVASEAAGIGLGLCQRSTSSSR